DTVSLRTVGGHAHSLGGSRLAVMDEHIEAVVRVAGDEVRCSALERDEATVGREAGVEAADEDEFGCAAVALRPVGGNAHAFGRLRPGEPYREGDHHEESDNAENPPLHWLHALLRGRGDDVQSWCGVRAMSTARRSSGAVAAQGGLSAKQSAW